MSDPFAAIRAAPNEVALEKAREHTLKEFKTAALKAYRERREELRKEAAKEKWAAVDEEG
jgi:hypothetical protein